MRSGGLPACPSAEHPARRILTGLRRHFRVQGCHSGRQDAALYGSQEYLFSVVELVALRRVAPRPAAQRLNANRAVRARRSTAARGGVVAARQPLPLNRYARMAAATAA